MCKEGPDRFLAEMDRSILREVIQQGRDQGGKDKLAEYDRNRLE